MRTINFGYTVPSKLVAHAGLSSLKVFVNVTNPFILYNPAGKATNGLVFDPETNSFGGVTGGTFSGSPAGPNGGRVATIGYGSDPRTRDFVFGINVRF